MTGGASANLARWALVWLGLGIFFASRLVTIGKTGGAPVAWGEALALCLPYWAIWGLFSLAVVRLGRAFPLIRPARPLGPLRALRSPRLLLHGLFAVAFALLHAGAMLGLEWLRHGASSPSGAEFFAAGRWGDELRGDFHFDALTYLFILVARTRIERRRELARREVQAARLAEQLAEARLAALRMQLHPHFLFNTLNSIAELLRLEVDAAERMVQRLAGLLRAALATASDPETTLREELEFVERYLDIERVRFGDRLIITFDTEAGLADAAVPGLILQPLVENAMRHGLAHRDGLGHLRIVARRVDEGLELSVENDAPGPDGAQPAASGSGIGVGLSNTRDRLAQIYGGRARCVIERPPGRYRVRLTLPLRSHRERHAVEALPEVTWSRA